MAYQAPHGMDNLDINPAQNWIAEHVHPNAEQMNHLLQHVYPAINQVLTICRLSSRQKYAVLRQGVVEIADMKLLGTSIEKVQNTLKHFNSLTEARGGVNFGALHYTRIFALAEYARDRTRRQGQQPDAVGFTQEVMDEYISKSQLDGKTAESLDMADPPKLGEHNFYQWEEAVLAQLRTKK